MKITLIITCIVIGLFVLFQFYTYMATQNTETQSYKVIREEKEFEIRYYPSVTMASITSSVKSFRELGNTGFTKLAGYIFGGNKENKQIAMTAPVHMNIGDSVSSMSFVMPSSYNLHNLPKPNNAEVSIKTTPEEYVAAIRFGGFASSENIKKYTLLLQNELNKEKIPYHGSFRFLGYNPPYQLFGRRNEIIVAINANEALELKQSNY